MKKRILSAALSLAMLLPMMPVNALAMDEDGGLPSLPGEDTTFNDSQSIPWTEVLPAENEPELISETRIVEFAPFVTSAPTTSRRKARTLDGSGDVALKSGNYANWIDRIDVPKYATDFYDSMVNNSKDATGWLVDPTKNTTTITSGGVTYYAVVFNIATGSYTDKTDFDTKTDQAFDTDSKYLYAVCAAFDRDHPEVFWLDKSTRASMSASGDGENYTVTTYLLLKAADNSFDIRASDYQDVSAITNAISTRDTQVNTITSGATGAVTENEKVKYFNKWLTENNGYNSSSKLNDIGHDCRTCMSALKGTPRGETSPVCEGYARALKVLCDSANIPCVLVDGTAKNTPSSSGEAHMWNYVQIEDKWYGVDVTWNDPVLIDTSGNKSDGNGNEKYLLVGSDTMIDEQKFIESHPVANKVSNQVVGFINGPELATEELVGRMRLSYSAAPTSMTVGTAIDDMNPTITNDVSGTPSYAVTSGSLPAGLDFDTSTGKISGTPNKGCEAGDVTITLTKGSTTADAVIHFPAVARKSLATGDITFSSKGNVQYQEAGYALDTRVSQAVVSLSESGAVKYTYSYNGTAIEGEYTWAQLATVNVKNVGTYEVTAKYLSDASEGQKTVSFEITKANQAPLTITSAAKVDFDQTLTLETSGGSGTGDITWSVTSETGEATISGTMLTPVKAGTVKVTATKAGDNNYNEGTTVEQTITINQATYGDKEKNVSIRAGRTLDVPLTGLFPENSSFGTITSITDSDGILDGTPEVSGTTLSVKIKDTAEVDQTAQIVVPVTNTNYANFDITVTVTVVEKDTQTISFTDGTVNKTYGDVFTQTVNDAETDVTYSSDNEDIATVDPTTGEVTIVGVGSTEITATAEETDDYTGDTAFYVLNVAKKDLTIRALDRNVVAGTEAPVLGSVPGTDYSVTGLVGSDQVTDITLVYAEEVPPEVLLSLARDIFTPDTSVVGNTCRILIEDVTVDHSDCYNIIKTNGTLTVVAKPVDPEPEPEPEPEPTPDDNDNKFDRKPSNSGGGSSSNSSSTGTTTTRPDGSTVTTETGRDGTVTQKVEAADGTVSETVTSPNGKTEVSVSLPSRGEDTVTLPISAVQPNLNSSLAPEINISIPSARGSVKTEIPVQNVTAGTVAVLVAPDGTETIVKTSVPTDTGISLSVSGNVTVKVIDNTKPFGDVTHSDWHKDAVDFVSARGLFNGTSANTFAPNGTMTRGMLATVLYNLEGNPASSDTRSFPDVSNGDWFANAVQWASSTGLMNGYSNGSFGANDAITREQLAVILWAHAGKPAVSGSLAFGDAASVSDYAQQAMIWATQNGIIAGSNNNLTPGGSASRAQVAQMLMNYLKAYQQ